MATRNGESPSFERQRGYAADPRQIHANRARGTLREHGGMFDRTDASAFLQGDEIRGDRTWSRPFNLKYRFSAGEPVFEAALYIRDSDRIPLPDGEDWLRDEDGAKSCGSLFES